MIGIHGPHGICFEKWLHLCECLFFRAILVIAATTTTKIELQKPLANSMTLLSCHANCHSLRARARLALYSPSVRHRGRDWRCASRARFLTTSSLRSQKAASSPQLQCKQSPSEWCGLSTLAHSDSIAHSCPLNPTDPENGIMGAKTRRKEGRKASFIAR